MTNDRSEDSSGTPPNLGDPATADPKTTPARRIVPAPEPTPGPQHTQDEAGAGKTVVFSTTERSLYYKEEVNAYYLDGTQEVLEKNVSAHWIEFEDADSEPLPEEIEPGESGTQHTVDKTQKENGGKDKESQTQLDEADDEEIEKVEKES